MSCFQIEKDLIKRCHYTEKIDFERSLNFFEGIVFLVVIVIYITSNLNDESYNQ